jgi:putative (di)nucleoside polyphosphate hydrolase
MKKGFHGKEQHYFLCDFVAPDSRINVATKEPEFRAYMWIDPGPFPPALAAEMKRRVYRSVFMISSKSRFDLVRHESC